MTLSSITPVILTWNEEPNLRRCLEGLTWAKEVVVLDSGSDDATSAICAEYPNVRFAVRPFDNHTNQWNHGISLASTRWILSFDADYSIHEDFVRELEGVAEGSPEVAWKACFRFLIHGRLLRGSLYPPRAVLFERNHCRYVPDGHTQTLQNDGPCGMLQSKIDHDDRKPLSRWLSSQWNYAKLEAEKLEAGGHDGLPDRLRRMIWPAAPAAFLYTLFVKRTILDGWAGWFYTLQRTYAELLLSLVLLEKKLGARSRKPGAGIF